MRPNGHRDGRAWFAPGLLAEGLVDVATDLRALQAGGWWAVLVTFEGRVRLWRFSRVARSVAPPVPRVPWRPVTGWTSSMTRAGYLAAVHDVRARIREGEVYQVNVCRVLEAPGGGRHDAGGGDPWALAARLAAGNPAPHACVLDVPGARLVSASPELFLSREGELVRSSPIKGTGATAADLLPKDDAENVMIVDLVRNDLQQVCRPGTVEVTALLRRRAHPGLVHLESTVEGRLAPGVTWARLFEALDPPASVSGAPKHTALRAIRDLEPVARGPYCGAVGWIDADRGRACLAVGIRTFWWRDDRLRFGTGAGITHGSDPAREWDETCLKARRLLALTGGGDPEGTTGDGAWSGALTAPVTIGREF